MARWCPRLAGLPSDESGLPEALAAELVTMECLELMCEHPETSCERAADIAEALGDAGAAARLRERAGLARELEKRLWGPISEEEKKESGGEDMKVLAKRLLALCRQGHQRYCRSLEKYCELEGHPPDVCPSPGTVDAGTR